MSEYQYYEFVAVDRPLTDEERAALRQITSRALITPWRLQNVYNWGNFKGDPLELMERYFDLFVYVANWGSRQFMVRLPRRVLPASDAAPYDGYDALDVLTRGEHVILDMHRIDEDGGGWIEDEEAESWVPALLPLRADLAAGDLRALYIAWLAGVSLEDMDREATEPPVPAGSGNPLRARGAGPVPGVDRDLLEAAAETSPALAEARRRGAPHLASRPGGGGEDDVLERLVVGNDPTCAQSCATLPRCPDTSAGIRGARRLVGDILDRAAALREARERAARLERLAARQAEVWDEVEALIATRLPKNYQQAVAYLVDLRDLAERDGTTPAYQERLGAIRERHGRKVSLMRELDAALERRD